MRKAQELLRSMRPERKEPTAEGAPEVLSISYDRLRLIVADFVRTIEGSRTWASYTGVALTLWCSLVVTEFSPSQARLGLSGEQWEVIFIVAAAWFTFRSFYGFVSYLRRPRLSDLLARILSNAEITREHRAICLLKVRGQDHDYRILVYRDPLWDCYLLPHYNIADVQIQDVDDPILIEYVAGFIGVPSESLSSSYISGVDLKSRKHSEFYRQGTLYKFAFYRIGSSAEASDLPEHLRQKSFVYHGRVFEWLAISEMEADQNTRNRNLDMTRHLADHATLLLSVPPDSFSPGAVSV